MNIYQLSQIQHKAKSRKTVNLSQSSTLAQPFCIRCNNNRNGKQAFLKVFSTVFFQVWLRNPIQFRIYLFASDIELCVEIFPSRRCCSLTVFFWSLNFLNRNAIVASSARHWHVTHMDERIYHWYEGKHVNYARKKSVKKKFWTKKKYFFFSRTPKLLFISFHLEILSCMNLLHFLWSESMSMTFVSRGSACQWKKVTLEWFPVILSHCEQTNYNSYFIRWTGDLILLFATKSFHWVYCMICAF